jgi:dTDP-4-dehydrorhamnose reductase
LPHDNLQHRSIELWGGVECTIVRIGEQFRNQALETGHVARPADLEAIASLGVKAVRYPILWEAVAPESPHELDFSWQDQRLNRLRELGIEVVGGLVHHGSGPRYTDLLDAAFPEKLADYARRVAQRYPWIKKWTPVNEPLTTSRFSCLYGHWFPHVRDTGAMYRALVHECLGTAQAIAAIREVIPDAELLVTEDLGKTFSTPKLARQAEYENHRRWLSLDLLCGRVTADHPFHEKLMKHVPAANLEELASGDGRPDIIGVNHYLTSERFLDHRVERYPHVQPGTNGKDVYVDVEAVRIESLRGEVGPGRRLSEAWHRYKLPIVVTEVHHGCTREEQVRWLNEVWTAAVKERSKGADIRAVTLWSMFGAVDWRSLLTARENSYDVGAFDVRSEAPRPTLLAKAAAKLGSGEPFEHPVLDLPGWWKRPGRCYARPRYDTMPSSVSGARPLLITGATGTLGQAFSRICCHRGLAHVLTTRSDLDITSEQSIAAALDRVKPWAVINAAGFVRTWEAAQKSEECMAINAVGADLLARACKMAGLPFVTFSSDLVFDGQLGRSYVESDTTAPVCTYGRSKAEAEARIAALGNDALIIRTSAFFGPWDRHNFIYETADRLKRGEDVFASANAIVSPTYVPDLVHAALDLLLDEEKGIWHVTNQGAISWHELARGVADFARVSPKRVVTANEPQAVNTSLSSKRSVLLRPLDQALGECLEKSEPLRLLLSA